MAEDDSEVLNALERESKEFDKVPLLLSSMRQLFHEPTEILILGRGDRP